MKIDKVPRSGSVYSCNSYYLRGNMNSVGDKNIIIDPGADKSILTFLQEINGGVGKKKIDYIFVTHQHFDHTLMLKEIKLKYHCLTLGFQEGPYLDRTVNEGDIFRAGDSYLQVYHTPGHTFDSICLHSPAEKLLFSGDTPLIIRSPDNTYHRAYVETLEKLSSLVIKTIYPGHGNSYPNEGFYSIEEAYKKAKSCRIIE